MKFRSLRPIFPRYLAQVSTFLAAITLLAAPLAFAAAPANPPLTDIVDDQTALALFVSDAPALVRGWDASPFARTWNDQQVAKFFGPLRATMNIETWDDQAKAATGTTVRELLALAKGGAIIALPVSLLSDAFAGKTITAPPLLLAIEFGSNAATVEKLAADAATKNAGLRVETTNYAGVLVHTQTQSAPKDGEKSNTSVPDVTAMCQGIWLNSPSYQRVCAAIDAIKRGGLSNAIGRSENFLRAQKRAGPAQLTAYADFQAIYPALQAAVEKVPTTNLPFEPTTALKALGFDALRGLCYTINFGVKETRVTFGLGYTEERGLLQLLAAYGPGAAERPEWLPAKFFSAASDKFDLRAAYVALESVLAAASPELSAQAQSGIADLNKELGVDLKRDFIGSLGADLVMGQYVPDGASLDKADQLIALSLENPESFAKVVEALKRLAAGNDPGGADQLFVKRTYLGQTLYTFAPPGAPAGYRGFSYAIANRTFLLGIGSPAPVEAVLQNMAEKRASFWNKSEVKAALADVPASSPDVWATDARALVGGMIDTLAGVLAQSPVSIVDASAKPDPAQLARYWGMMSGYLVKEPTSFFGVARIANPSP